ncbi:GlsB/YeaQ/YmgE family stress response membrane protein [Xylophilus sp. ASV27]|uniref:GlsB/YeaQ/YmgE family stress response membrane protein n=1 Tax=Xylophilus sp. ASV27 TaxID=2795129 RepID=UPI0018ECE700|nr:GlsB/YeaQ/YmgE family stress response membrane protein [Xylophilus sp. ASV27]
MTTGLFWVLFAGFIVGMLVNAFKPLGRMAGMTGLLVTAAIGIAGALAASLSGEALHWWSREHLNGFTAAVIGALIVLLATRFFLRPRALPAA